MNLMEESKRISRSIEEKLEEINGIIKELRDECEAISEELKIAAAHGDLSENAEFKEAQKNLTSAQMNLSKNYLIRRNIESLPDESKYTSIGIITPYTTIHLRNVTLGTDMIIKLIPNGISDPFKSIIATDAPIGHKLMFKSKGDTFTMIHRQTGTPIEFHIIDIY